MKNLIVLSICIIIAFNVVKSQSYGNGVLFGESAHNEKLSKFYVPNVPSEPVLSNKYLTVGFIDTGVDLNHPQIKPFIVDYRDFTGFGKYDSIGHGTNVVLAYLKAEYDDKSPKDTVYSRVIIAKIVDVKCKTFTQNDIIEALLWLKEKEVTAINISLGFTGSKDENYQLCKTIMDVSKEIPIYAAAGNLGDIDVWPACCSQIFSDISQNKFQVVGDYSITSGKCATVNEESTIQLSYDSDYYYHMGINFLGIQDTTSAINYFLKSDSLAISSDTRMELMNLYSSLRNYKMARLYAKKFTETFKLDSLNNPLYLGYMCARIYVNEKDLYNAQQNLEDGLNMVAFDSFIITELNIGVIKSSLELLLLIYCNNDSCCKISHYRDVVKKVYGEESDFYNEILKICNN